MTETRTMYADPWNVPTAVPLRDHGLTPKPILSIHACNEWLIATHSSLTNALADVEAHVFFKTMRSPADAPHLAPLVVMGIAERFREDWLNCICEPEANGSVRADAVSEMTLDCMVSHFVIQMPPIQRVFEARSQYLERHDTDLPHAYCDLNADTPQDKSCWVAGTRWLPAPTQYTGYFSERKIKALAHAYETAV
jgi:hypothetical protein